MVLYTNRPEFMTFTSILFTDNNIEESDIQSDMPSFFTDLNLDQVFHAILKGKEEYQLTPFFYSSLQNPSQIYYRQDVFRDFENKDLFMIIKTFSQKMVIMRRYLELLTKLNYKHHTTGWFLEAVLVYCEAVQALTQDLSMITINSMGLNKFQKFISNYQSSENFKSLQQESNSLKKALKDIDYCIIIKDAQIQVLKYKKEIKLQYGPPGGPV